MTDPENDSHCYRAWLNEKRQMEAPDGFAERVVDRLTERRFPEIPQWARAAILIVAAIGGIGRYLLLIILTFLS